MKKISVFVFAATLALASCGSGDDKNEGGEEKKQSSSNCKLETSIDVTSSGVLSGFESKKAFAFLGGWQTGSNHRSKLSICFANYEAELSSFDIKRPKEEGQLIIQMNITGESSSKDEKLKPHKTGTFTYGSSFQEEPSAQVIVWDPSGPAEGYKMISSQDIAVELTHIDENSVCGTAKIKIPNGTTMDMSFNLPIEKDFWEKQR